MLFRVLLFEARVVSTAQDEVAMMVLARSTESTEGVGASTSELVVHSVTHPLECLLSTQGLGKDLKTHWLRCHLPHCC